MFPVPNLLMIGGNTRNSGKTTLACSIISKFSVHTKVIGLKVTSVRPDEDAWHGDHSDDNPSKGYSIREELNIDSHKDTSVMLRAGAHRVFYIRTDEEHQQEAFRQFSKKIIDNQVIVCESRGLRKTIVPGLFIMMMGDPAVKNAKDVSEYLEEADKVFDFRKSPEEISGFIESLKFESGKFMCDE